MKRIAAVTFVTSALLSSVGCVSAGLPPLSEDLRSQLGSIEVRIAKVEPRIEVSTPPRGWLSGLGTGFVEGLILAPIGFLAPFDPPLAGAALMPIIDPIRGATKAPSAEVVNKTEASLRSALRSNTVRECLAEQLQLALHDPRRAALDEQRPAKSIVEVGVESYGLSNLVLGVLHDERAYIVARVRILRADNRVVLYEARTRWESGEHPFEQWPEKLNVHLNAGCKVLAWWIANAIHPVTAGRSVAASVR
jgi:hypothetical protein